MAEQETQQHRDKGFLLWLAALVICGAVFLGSLWYLIGNFLESRQERAANERLSAGVQRAENLIALGNLLLSDRTEEAIVPSVNRYSWLANLNPDFCGWLSVADTDLDYPVMYTPKEPEHYLRRGFDGKYAASGSLFIGEGSAPDSSHVVIYGHNMKNGAMFGSLMPYAKKSYWQAHPMISFNTLERAGEYEVIGAFYSQVYTDADEGVFRYYRYTDLTKETVFNEYIRQVKAASLYDTEVDAHYGDEILTLSTCSYHTDDGRFVVVARRKAE